MPRYFFAFILLVLLSVPGRGHAVPPCPAPPQPPKVSVFGTIQPPVVGHQYSVAQLTQLGRSAPSPYSPGSKVIVQGLTRGGVAYQMKSSITIMSSGNRMYSCYYFKDITITMDSTPEIYIASEIPENTCLYREVMNHELTHYNIIRDVIRDYIPAFWSQLNGLVARVQVLGPFQGNSQAQAMQQMKSYIDSIFHGIQPQMGRDMNNRHARLDTKAEYERVKAACPQDLKYMKHF